MHTLDIENERIKQIISKINFGLTYKISKHNETNFIRTGKAGTRHVTTSQYVFWTEMKVYTTKKC